MRNKKHRWYALLMTSVLLAGTIPMNGAAASESTETVGIEEDTVNAENEENMETSDLLADLKSNTVLGDDVADAQEEHRSLHFAADWSEIFTALKNAKNDYWDDYMVYEAAVEDTAYATSSNVDTSSRAVYKTTDSTDYSTTNLREADVDEADIVKTDGEYIYLITGGNTLTIVKVEGSDSMQVSAGRVGQSAYGDDWRTEAGEDGNVILDLVGYETGISITPQEMYVDGDTLVLIRTIHFNQNGSQYGYSDYQTVTSVDTYDISDRAHPVLSGSVLQQGSYNQSRKQGDIVYLYTTEWPEFGWNLEESNLEVIINGESLAPDQFCIPELVTDREYLIISSVSTKDPSSTLDHKVYVSGGEKCYATTDSLYVLTSYYSNSGSGSRTEIAAFDTLEGQISGRSAAVVRGYVNDTWSIDAHDGYVRVLTTYTGPSTSSLIEMLQNMSSLEDYFDWYDGQTWVRHNALYVLDADLNRVGLLSDLAKNEEIRSARYFGDLVYFVTYENTDPVFCVDLSDPAQPTVLGELKVSGFSAYLHPYGEGKLLGMGYETDEETGNTLGLKLSMFDTSERGEVTEISRVVIPGITWCPALNDYKSIFVSPEKNIIGLYYDERYYVYSFDGENGFTRVLLYDYLGDDLGGTTEYSTMRGLYIGEDLYLAGGTSVIGFDMSHGFEKFLVLKELGTQES